MISAEAFLALMCMLVFTGFALSCAGALSGKSVSALERLGEGAACIESASVINSYYSSPGKSAWAGSGCSLEKIPALLPADAEEIGGGKNRRFLVNAPAHYG